jgi:hypothetical protein
MFSNLADEIVNNQKYQHKIFSKTKVQMAKDLKKRAYFNNVSSKFFKILPSSADEIVNNKK